MKDFIDEAFDNLYKAELELQTSKFICARCQKEKLLFRSVLVPIRGAPGIVNRHICYDCFCEVKEALFQKGDNL